MVMSDYVCSLKCNIGYSRKSVCMYLRIPSVLPRRKSDDTVQASPVVAPFLLRL